MTNSDPTTASAPMLTPAPIRTPASTTALGCTPATAAGRTRLAHHWVVVCRAGEPRQGPRALAAAFHKGDHTGALRIGVDLVKTWPWAARAWSDLAVAWNAVGRNDRAAEAALRAWRLDPMRPETAENLDAMGVTATTDDLELGLMLAPESEQARTALVAELVSRGQLHAAATVQRTLVEGVSVAAK